MDSESALSPEFVASKLSESGFFVLDSSGKLDVDRICSKFQKLIDAKDINYPRTSLSSTKMLHSQDLDQYHQNLNSEENRISLETYQAGEEKWRDIVPHVTVKDPLLQIPDIVPFVLDGEIQKIASHYLKGNAKVGYVKIKKSYANNLDVRTYNHVFHKDDNQEKILKALVYLRDVSPCKGGGFNYVARSKTRSFESGKVYFTDEEIRNSFKENEILEFSGPAGLTVIADTIGIHKEGRALDCDRWIMIVNFVLNEEYGGTRPRQIMAKAIYDRLDKRQRDMCSYMNIQGD